MNIFPVTIFGCFNGCNLDQRCPFAVSSVSFCHESSSLRKLSFFLAHQNVLPDWCAFCPRTGSFWWKTSFRDHHLEKPLLPGKARHFFFFLFSSWIYLTYRKVKVLVAQSCPTLCNPMDYISRQVPLSVGFFRQEYWSGLPCRFPCHLPDPGIKTLQHFLHWQVDSLPLTTWEAYLFPQALLMETSELYTSLHFNHKYTICFLTTSPTNYTDSFFFFFCQLCINIDFAFLSPRRRLITFSCVWGPFHLFYQVSAELSSPLCHQIVHLFHLRI